MVVLRDRPTAWARCGAQQRKYALIVGAISPVSYVLVLYAMQTAPLSHVAPAREVSMLFAALIGGHLLGEGDRAVRLVGAVCIAVGVGVPGPAKSCAGGRTVICWAAIFPAAPAAKTIAIATGRLRDNGVALSNLEYFTSLDAWAARLAQPGERRVGGFDMPFGLPRELVQVWLAHRLGRLWRPLPGLSRADIRSTFKAFAQPARWGTSLPTAPPMARPDPA